MTFIHGKTGSGAAALALLLALVLLLPSVGIAAGPVNPQTLEGAIVKGSGPELYVIEHGLRRHISSMEVLRVFHFEHRSIEVVSDTTLSAMVSGDSLGLFSYWPDGTLLKGTGPRVYLVSHNTRRWIVNGQVFRNWGFRDSRITRVPDDALRQIVEGAAIIGSPPKAPETTILTGPDEGSTIETTSVTFGFTGVAGDGTRNVNFETYLKGFDSQWVSTTRTERSFDLERKDGTYTLFVRAVGQDGTVDPTPASRTFSTRLSPFGKYVRIASTSGSATSPDNETVTIDVLSSAPAPIDLTDFTVANNLGYSFHLPKVQTVYRAGQQLPSPDPLLVAAGGHVVVTIGRSALGVSVRVNRCMPYLNRSAGLFKPLISLFGDCPQLPQDVIERYTGKACLDYLQTQSACSIPDPIPFPDNVRLGSSCISFISQHYTYNGCVDDHQPERDFYTNEWRVDGGFSRDFFPTGKERVEVRDRDGKLVDKSQSFFFGF